MLEEDIIKNISDLKHPKSRELIAQYQIPLKELIYRTKKTLNLKQAPDLNTNNPNVPLNIHNEYIKDLTSAIIIHYELSKRNIVSIQGEKEYFTRVSTKQLCLLKIKKLNNIINAVTYLKKTLLDEMIEKMEKEQLK